MQNYETDERLAVQMVFQIGLMEKKQFLWRLHINFLFPREASAWPKLSSIPETKSYMIQISMNSE